LQLVIRGGAIEALGVVCVPLIVVTFLLPDAARVYWAAALVTIGVSAAIIGGVMGLFGYHKLKKEREAGYTTSPQDARKYPTLFWLHPVTMQVMLRPHEPRPPMGALGKQLNMIAIIRGR